MNNQDKATMYWREITTFIDPSLLNENLKSLIENTYLGSSENFYFVLDFLLKNDLYIGFPMLLKELEDHGELQRGQEVFVLAHVVKSLCGVSNEFYTKLPKVIREVLAGPVILKNVDNNGYMLADKRLCSKEICLKNPSSQVHVDLLPSTTTTDDLKNNSLAQWQFSGPENFTALSEGFYIKNMHHDQFFIFNQRPPQGYLRSSSSLMSYNSGDKHAQFLPALVPNAGPDENIMRIGVRERFSKSISYFYSREFSNKVKSYDMGRLPMFRDEVKTFVWEVIPVNGDLMDNAIEGGEINEKCKFTM